MHNYYDEIRRSSVPPYPNMIKKCSQLRCRTDRAHTDFAAIQQRMPSLKNPIHWELSTPSSALPVLDLLSRAGVTGNDFEKAASPSLLSMSPLMTRSERLLLKKRMTTLFGRGRSTGVTELPLPSSGPRSDTKSVYQVYRLFAKKTCIASGELLAALGSVDVGRTDSAALLMMIELISREVRESAALHAIAEAAFGELVSRVSADSTNYRLLHVALMYLRSCAAQTRFHSQRMDMRLLWEGCVRGVHVAIPGLAATEVLFLLLLLHECYTGSQHYEKPFVLVSELERILLAADGDALADAPVSAILRLLDLPFIRNHNKHFSLSTLCGLYSSGRLGDASAQEAGFSLKLVSELHEENRQLLMSHCEANGATPLPTSTSAPVGRAVVNDLHDCLFAVLYTDAASLSAAECLAVLEYSEKINCSLWGIPVHGVFSRRMKDTLLHRLMKGTPTAGADRDSLLRAAIGLRNLLSRCTLLPLAPKDAHTLDSIISNLSTPPVSG